jgi:iron complex outermembrane recepter protein
MLRSSAARRFSRHMLLGTVALTAALFPTLHQALGAENTAEDDRNRGGLEEIVVTAQKRPQDLQQTPIAIAVLSADQLESRHVQSLLDLGDGAIPSLRVAPFFSRSSALVMNIRGVGVMSDSNQPARDQGVGVYIDGVYLGRTQGLGTALYDVESIEVLKGPQGTLFGRNTEGGAINIVTRKPSGKFGMRALTGVSNYEGRKAEVRLDLPAFNNIALKFDGLVSKRGGTADNPLDGAKDFNAFNKRGLHAQARWEPATNFSADYSFDISRDASTPLFAQAISAGSLPRAPITPIQPRRAKATAVGAPQEYSVGETHGHRVTLDWQAAPGIQLKSITSYRKLDQSQFDNGSGLATAVSATGNFTGVGFARYSLANFEQDQFSTELQVIGEADRIKYVGGALYYEEDVSDNAQAFNTLTITNAAGTAVNVLNLNPATQRIDRASRVKPESIGVFGQATYTPEFAGDIAHLTVGARYTDDKKKGQLNIVNGAPPTVDGVTAPRVLDASWSRVDPLINLSIDAARDVMFYGKWSTGYRAGGANSRSLRFAPYDPEEVSMFELGAKTEFWDNRARFNVAAYTATYKDVQLDFFATFQQLVNGVLVNNLRTTSETANAPGNGRIKGLEADLTLAPADGLTLSASYAYNDASLPATANPFPQSNGVIVPFPVPIYAIYSPKNAASGAIDYEIPQDGYKLVAHIDANYTDGYFANNTDPGFNAATGQVTVPQPKGESAFIVNARLAIADIEVGSSGQMFTVSAWSRNLFNDEHVYYKSFSTLTGGTGIFNEPRTYGLDVSVKF